MQLALLSPLHGMRIARHEPMGDRGARQSGTHLSTCCGHGGRYSILDDSFCVHTDLAAIQLRRRFSYERSYCHLLGSTFVQCTDWQISRQTVISRARNRHKRHAANVRTMTDKYKAAAFPQETPSVIYSSVEIHPGTEKVVYLYTQGKLAALSPPNIHQVQPCTWLRDNTASPFH